MPADVVAAVVPLTLIVVIGGASWVRHGIAETDAARIRQLITANRARPRPGMERRDDVLLQRAEQRARDKRCVR